MSEKPRESRSEIMRSKLFVPASKPAFFSKALVSAVDAICFDLEDSVLPAQKALARSDLRKFVGSGVHTRKTIIVRVNHVRSADFAKDLFVAVSPGVSFLTLPKVDDPAEIREATEAMLILERERNIKRPISILVTIETARGLRLAESIAVADIRVAGLQLGLADLFEPLGIQQDDVSAAHQVRFKLRLAAGEAGVPCFDSAFSNFRDESGFIREAEMARNLGFAGKSCIHPNQIAPTNRIFSPSPEEIATSLRCVRAAQETSLAGAGAFALDGHMIDQPFVRRAQTILQLSEKIRLLDSDG